MHYKALVLFDIDGTLLKGSTEHRKAFYVAYRKIYERDIEIKPKTKNSGKTDKQIIKERMMEAGLTEKEIDAKIQDCFECMAHYYSENVHRDKSMLLSGVQHLLEECKKQNILMGLVTGNVKEIAYEKLKRLGIGHYFSCGGFGNEHQRRAELVKIAIEGARKVGFKGDIFVIGDTPRDIEAAKSAQEKITAIAVATGEFTKHELNSAGADYVLDDLINTKKIIGLFLPHHQRALHQ